MEQSLELAAALSVALALAVGMLTQSVARHLRIPGIVLLMAAGAVMGPDLLDVIRPDSLGGALTILVGMAVAVILFEGGLNLNLRRLRRQSRPIRLLLTVGTAITAAGGAIAARMILGWEWERSFLFGTLVIVTGPTVIQPLMRRIRVKRNVRTVLEAEGVFIDAIGATVAVVALGIVTNPATSFRGAALLFAGKIGFGIAAGAAAGFGIALLLKLRHVVPEGLENVFTLSLVLALYQGAHAIFPESGIAAVTVAGLVVGNVRTRALPDLKAFEEQLTVLLIGMLFVLLAADVRLSEVRTLGWPGLLTVLALMLVVRPLNVAAATWRSDLSFRERTFLAWLAPRGIVAAAIASLFADELTMAGIPGGRELRALVFLVIAVTVLLQGLTGGLAATLLRVRRPAGSGHVILGANEMGLALGKALRATGAEVIFMDANPQRSHRAEEEGFRVIFGNALEERLLRLAELDTRAGCIGITPNEEMNLLFAVRAMESHGAPRAYVGLQEGDRGITREMVHEAGATLLFGAPRNVARWSAYFARDETLLEAWRWQPSEEGGPTRREATQALSDGGEDHIVPLAVKRDRRVVPVDDGWEPRRDDFIFVAVHVEFEEACHNRLAAGGWVRGELPVGTERGPVWAG